MTDQELKDLLDAKIPRDVVSERDGGGGRKLSYLEGWYVIDRLNQVFGPLGWSKEILDVRQVVNTTSRGEFPAYLVKIKLTVRTASAFAFKEAYGYGADKSPQNAHELAIKEAVTDALKVAAKDLGMSMGLALYDKSQENVDDGEEERTETKSKPGNRNSGGAVSNTSSSVQPASAASGAQSPKAGTPAPSQGKSEKAPKREELNSLITSTARVVIAKKNETLDSIKAHLSTTYKVDNKEALTDDQAADLLNWLKGRLNG